MCLWIYNETLKWLRQTTALCICLRTVCYLWFCVPCSELFFISFHHGTRREQETENIFRTQTEDCFFGEQSFSSDYVKHREIQLFRESEKQRQTASERKVTVVSCRRIFSTIFRDILDQKKDVFVPKVAFLVDSDVCKWGRNSMVQTWILTTGPLHLPYPALFLYFFWYKYFVLQREAQLEHRWPQMGMQTLQTS